MGAQRAQHGNGHAGHVGHVGHVGREGPRRNTTRNRALLHGLGVKHTIDVLPPNPKVSKAFIPVAENKRRRKSRLDSPPEL
jgi:hypothetical protein